MNKRGAFVRQAAAGVSGGAPADRRVLRTQRALTHALIDLVSTKRYQDITVQELLDCADVGRSTFYSHYRGKDDLLLRSFERMLDRLDQEVEPCGSAAPRVAPVRELFRHVGSFRSFHHSLSRARMLDRVYQAGVDHMSGTIERRIAALPDRPGGDSVAPMLTARALAGALFALLRWWVDHDSPYSPEQMDEIYHAIVMAGVEP